MLRATVELRAAVLLKALVAVAFLGAAVAFLGGVAWASSLRPRLTIQIVCWSGKSSLSTTPKASIESSGLKDGSAQEIPAVATWRSSFPSAFITHKVLGRAPVCSVGSTPGFWVRQKASICPSLLTAKAVSSAKVWVKLIAPEASSRQISPSRRKKSGGACTLLLPKGTANGLLAGRIVVARATSMTKRTVPGETDSSSK